MEQFWALMQYFRDNPATAAAAGAAVVALYALLNRKTKLSREVDQRLDRIRKERGDYYNKTRKLR